jgi:hypothetical protein
VFLSTLLASWAVVALDWFFTICTIMFWHICCSFS